MGCSCSATLPETDTKFAQHSWSEGKAQKPRGFTVEDANRMWRASWIAYMDDKGDGTVRKDGAEECGFMDPAGLDATLQQGMGGTWPEMKLLTYFNHMETDTQAYVAVSKDGSRLLLGCRGTTTPTDWLHNVEATSTAFEPMIDGDTPGNITEDKFGWCGSNVESRKPQVHRGFYAAFLPLRAVIDKYMVPLCKDETTEVKELSVVGHSLGGALAILCFVYMVQRRPSLHKYGIKVNIFTYGSPRVGDAEFRTFLHKQAMHLRSNKLLRHYRVRLGSDIVPTVPPRFLGYVHAGRVVQCTQDAEGNIAEMFFQDDGWDEEHVEASECKNLEGHWIQPSWLSNPVDGIQDHMASSYDKALRGLVSPFSKNVPVLLGSTSRHRTLQGNLKSEDCTKFEEASCTRILI